MGRSLTNCLQRIDTNELIVELQRRGYVVRPRSHIPMVRKGLQTKAIQIVEREARYFNASGLDAARRIITVLERDMLREEEMT